MSEMWPETTAEPGIGGFLHNMLGGVESEPGPPYVHAFRLPEPISWDDDGLPVYPPPGPSFTITGVDEEE